MFNYPDNNNEDESYDVFDGLYENELDRMKELSGQKNKKGSTGYRMDLLDEIREAKSIVEGRRLSDREIIEEMMRQMTNEEAEHVLSEVAYQKDQRVSYRKK